MQRKKRKLKAIKENVNGKKRPMLLYFAGKFPLK